MTVTWRNPTSASTADPHVRTQQRPGHISALTRVVTSQSLRVMKPARRDASSRTDFKGAQTNTGAKNLAPVSESFGQSCKEFFPLFSSFHTSPLKTLSIPPKSFQTPMRLGLLSHPSDSQALNGTCHGSACPRTKDNCDLDKHWGEGGGYKGKGQVLSRFKCAPIHLKHKAWATSAPAGEVAGAASWCWRFLKEAPHTSRKSWQKCNKQRIAIIMPVIPPKIWFFLYTIRQCFLRGFPPYCYCKFNYFWNRRISRISSVNCAAGITSRSNPSSPLFVLSFCGLNEWQVGLLPAFSHAQIGLSLLAVLDPDCVQETIDFEHKVNYA